MAGLRFYKSRSDKPISENLPMDFRYSFASYEKGYGLSVDLMLIKIQSST